MRTLLLFIAIGVLSACTANLALANQEYQRAMTLISSSVEAEAAEGREALSNAAALGSSDAAITLGYYYLKGTNGFTEDPKKALELFEQAGKTGHRDAQYNTGLAYMRGIGTSIDLKKAYDWFLKAAYQDDTGAQYNTAVMLLNGDGVVADPLAAYAWFTLAAEKGHTGAAGDKAVARRELTSEQMQGLEAVLMKIRGKITKSAEPAPSADGVNQNAPL